MDVWNDHNPHFHATYNDFEILIRINDLSIYSGSLPSRAFSLVMEWASLINVNYQITGN